MSVCMCMYACVSVRLVGGRSEEDCPTHPIPSLQQGKPLTALSLFLLSSVSLTGNSPWQHQGMVVSFCFPLPTRWV